MTNFPLNVAIKTIEIIDSKIEATKLIEIFENKESIPATSSSLDEIYPTS